MKSFIKLSKESAVLFDKVSRKDKADRKFFKTSKHKVLTYIRFLDQDNVNFSLSE